ncbi:MAG: GH3 auxin-responsive promoter family protein [Dehalococcoidales bacterium]|nr:GH3 auxin-responsive promoter family protein [Dehalococcoidales bacterium]
MGKEAELIVQGNNEELWQRCCGFIDLSLEDFMEIQERLLLEQLEMLKKCKLGRSVMRGAQPGSMAEFRSQVSLTTYADYEPFLLTKNERALPAKPLFWQHTSGRSGEYSFKWAPVTARQYDEIRSLLFGCLAFSCCKEKGEIGFRWRDSFLYALAPPPYTTGALIHNAPHEVFNFLPPIKAAENMSFEERVQLGFELAVTEGLDLFFAMSSILVAIGERFSQRKDAINIRPLLKRPRVLLRLLKGLIKSKLARRDILPRDIWNLKGLVSTGSDGAAFRERVKDMWGRYPLDVYAGTEGLIMATQTWDYQGLTFIPQVNFFEFIPEEESLRSKADPDYEPETLLMDEVRAGEKYELVITSFHGMPFIRYRLGDMVKITSLRNEKLGIDIPQMEFYGRVDDIIDVAGFTRLTEKVIWQAIENTKIPYREWTLRKELRDRPVLHLYLELKKNGHLTPDQVAGAVHEQLVELDPPYADLEEFIGLRPLEVTLLPQNAFHGYMAKQQAAGADLAHLKPPHINPSDSMIECLVVGVEEVPVSATAEHEPEAVESR